MNRYDIALGKEPPPPPKEEGPPPGWRTATSDPKVVVRLDHTVIVVPTRVDFDENPFSNGVMITLPHMDIMISHIEVFNEGKLVYAKAIHPKVLTMSEELVLNLQF